MTAGLGQRDRPPGGPSPSVRAVLRSRLITPDKPIRFDADPRKILLIKPSSLGDVVHTLPILRLIRRRFPVAHLAWLINPAFAGLIEGHPDLNEVIRFERQRFARGFLDRGARAELVTFARDLRAKAFELVLDLQGLLRSGWLAWQSGARVRVGFANARELAPAFYTHRVPIDDVEVHAIQRYRALAEAIGCRGDPVEFDFAIEDADRAVIAETTRTATGGYVVMLPGTNWTTKRWPIEHFTGLVSPLRERYGLASIVAGAASDRELGDRVTGAINLAGRTTLRQLVALLEGAAVVIANDTGPMHIAAALGRPLVTLFGPTNPVRTGPYLRGETVARVAVPCSPCYSRRCAHTSCMNWLTPGMVLDAVGRQLRPMR